MKLTDAENAAVERIAKKFNYTPSPSDVVEAARNARSPIHGRFEWDDAKAAHQHRLKQARQILRVAVIHVKGHKKPARLVHVPITRAESKSKEGYYKPLPMIAENDFEWEAAYSQALQKLSAAQRAVKDLEESAEKRGDETLSLLSVALKAIETADSALRRVH